MVLHLFISICFRAYTRREPLETQITLAQITEEGVTISEPYSLTTDWQVGTMVRGYGSG